MNRIKKLRNKIDDIDTEILNLLNKRANIVIEIGKIKRENNYDFYTPLREQEIYERLSKINPGPFPNNALRSVFREIFSASLAMEKPLKVAFLGPKATFTHIACVQKFGLSGADLISHKSIQDIFDEVERGRIDYGVVPVENSTEGIVSHTLDMFMEYEVKIAGEILLEISHALLSKDGKIGNIKKIYSNPYAIAQCRNWLRNNLPDIPIHEVETTALAAQTAADNIGIAAIASESAAMLYNLQVIHKKIEDNINNYTRFLILSKKIPERSGYDKTSILFSVKDEVGILYKMLEPFAKNGINLTKIESRPMKKKPWEYVFFVDMEGHIEDDKVGGAIKELEKKSVFIKHLGSYPRCKDIN